MIVWFKLLTIILIVLYILAFFNLKKKGYAFSPIFAFLIGIFYFIIIPFSLFAIVGDFQLNPASGAKGYWTSINLNDEYFTFPFLITWTLLAGVAILVLVYPVSNNNKEPKKNYLLEINQSNYNRIIYLLNFSVIFILMEWIFKFVEFGGISSYFELHWYMRNEILFSDFGRLYVYINKFTQANLIIYTALSSLITLVYFGSEKKAKGRNVLLLFIIIFHLLIIIMTGNRIYFALYLLHVAFGLVVFNRYRYIIIGTILLPIFLVIFSAWSYTRSQLSNLDVALGNYFNSLKTVDNSLISMLIDITEGANVLVAFHIIKDYGNIYEFLNGGTYTRIFTSFLGNSDTLETFTVIMGKNYMPGTNVSLNSTVIGELYANFGLLTLFILPIITLIFLFFSGKFNINSNPILSIIACVLVGWFVRSVFSDNFIILIISLIIVAIELVTYKILLRISSKNTREVIMHESK